MVIFLGIIATLVGLAGVAICVIWMCHVTFTDHCLGTFWGQLWSTIGQEIVVVALLLAWFLAILGIFQISDTPTNWPLSGLFAFLFLPGLIIWGLAKVVSIKAMLTALEKKWLQIIYTGVVIWKFLSVLGIATFVPTANVGEYYGKVDAPYQLLWRVGQTISMIDQLRFYRAEIEDFPTAQRYLYESIERMDSWHSRREGWGGSRTLDKDYYVESSLALGLFLSLASESQGSRIPLQAKVGLLFLTDHWWADKRLEIPGLASSPSPSPESNSAQE